MKTKTTDTKPLAFPWHLFALLEAQASTEIETGKHVSLEELFEALLPKRKAKPKKPKAPRGEEEQ